MLNNVWHLTALGYRYEELRPTESSKILMHILLMSALNIVIHMWDHYIITGAKTTDTAINIDLALLFMMVTRMIMIMMLIIITGRGKNTTKYKQPHSELPNVSISSLSIGLSVTTWGDSVSWQSDEVTQHEWLNPKGWLKLLLFSWKVSTTKVL